MCPKITSIGLKGMEGYRINVEVKTFIGNDTIRIVGLPDAAVKESKERIMAALRSLGYTISGQKIIINLSPSEQKKSGPMFDLPMAIGVLLSLKELVGAIPEDSGFIGALSLDGAIVPVEGMLPAVLAAKKLGLNRLYMPYDERLPLLEFDRLQIIYITSLKELVEILEGRCSTFFTPKMEKIPPDTSSFIDFQQIIGHSNTKKALEIAAAGEHHVLMTGPPGCGKSMLAESFPSILPPLSKEAQLEVLALHQLSGTDYPNAINPPFRNPHHSASGIAIIGGGTYPKPGEISLSQGVVSYSWMRLQSFRKKHLICCVSHLKMEKSPSVEHMPYLAIQLRSS
jgi:magnesium chelatase family protein